MKRLRLACAFVLLCMAAYAQRQMTVAQLVEFVRSAIQNKQDDRKVADFIRTIKLTNKLDDRTVEDLQGLGAGSRTVAALRTLTDSTASLPAAPPPDPKPAPVVIPPPSAADQARIIAQTRENALNYTKGLPNFICTQLTKRHLDPSGTEAWTLVDTIQEHLTYVDQHEDYKVVMVNNKPVANMSHTQVGGSTSSGEFGTMLAEIFEPSSRTDFGWEKWTKLSGRITYVFNFRVAQQNSKYSIYHQPSGRTIIPGYHGLIYVDRETGMVMRLAMECDAIPADFPVQKVSEILYYDFVDISGHDYVLPLKADLRSREGRLLIWNEIEFHFYRKFGADATITFDTPDAIPDDKLKEEPVTPGARP